MTLVFLLILTLAWVVIFFPQALRLKRSSPLPAAESFRKKLELLAPRPPERGRWVLMPDQPGRAERQAFRRAQARKKRVLEVLLGTVVLTFCGAFVWSPLWRVNLFVAATLAVYVVLLIGSRRQRQEALQKIKPLAPPTSELGDAPEEIRGAGEG